MKRNQAYVLLVGLLIVVLFLAGMYWSSNKLSNSSTSINPNEFETMPLMQDLTRVSTQKTVTTAIDLGEGALVPLIFNRLRFVRVASQDTHEYLEVYEESRSGKRKLTFQVYENIEIELLNQRAQTVKSIDLSNLIEADQYVSLDTFFNDVEKPVQNVKTQINFAVSNGLPNSEDYVLLEPTSETAIDEIMISESPVFQLNQLMPLRIRVENQE